LPSATMETERHAHNLDRANPMTIEITRYNTELAERLPKIHALLLNAGLHVHDAVERVTLHGSRGLRGGARPDSDIDLCLVVSDSALALALDRDALLRAVLVTTLNDWRSPIEPDLAAVFDRSRCGLRCLSATDLDRDLCANTVDCMGVFKIQKGFDGYVRGPAVDCSKMYPLLTIWCR
jgi:predicted nucleotidyltransferase